VVQLSKVNFSGCLITCTSRPARTPSLSHVITVLNGLVAYWQLQSITTHVCRFKKASFWGPTTARSAQFSCLFTSLRCSKLQGLAQLVQTINKHSSRPNKSHSRLSLKQHQLSTHPRQHLKGTDRVLNRSPQARALLQMRRDRNPTVGHLLMRSTNKAVVASIVTVMRPINNRAVDRSTCQATARGATTGHNRSPKGT